MQRYPRPHVPSTPVGSVCPARLSLRHRRLRQYTAGKISFAGAPPAQQAALEATAKLHTGQAFSAADLQSAAQGLSDTGLFDNVEVKLDGASKAVAVNFTLKPIDPSTLLLVSFSNLYWFTPQELEAGVRARVPLFGSTLPESGNLIDAVQTALEAILQQRGITAKVSHDVYEPSSDRQARVVAYRVSNPLVIIRTVHLAGISPEFAPAIRTRAGKVAGSFFDDGLERRTTSERLLTPYLDAGYVDARIADRKLTPLTSTPEKTELDLAGTVIPGPLLHIGTLTWAGSPELSAAAFASAAPLHPGSIASATDLSKTIDLLAAPYRKEGYADVVINVVAQIAGADATAGTVNYTFTVVPGEQYRIKSITPLNLTPAQQAEFARGWHLKPGDLFDSDYITHFLERNTALRSFNNTSALLQSRARPGSPPRRHNHHLCLRHHWSRSVAAAQHTVRPC